MNKQPDPATTIIDKYFEKGAMKTMFQTLTGKNWMSNNNGRAGRRASSTVNNNADLFDGDNKDETRSESELLSKMLGFIKRYNISV